MKLFIVTIFHLFFVFTAEAQPDKVTNLFDTNFNERDSVYSLLCVIDKYNNTISEAYNGLALGLKAKQIDSMLIMVNNYKGILDTSISKFETIEVANFLIEFKNAYIESLKSLNSFFAKNSSTLLDADNLKRSLLLKNQETDTKYIDRQISDFFKDMNNSSIPWNQILELEKERLIEISETLSKTKK